MQREFINYLIKEVNTAVFKDISEVETFVKWLDGELTCLVDERAVLKHFSQWPERKADALREAACCFKDLKNLECDIVSYKDNPKQPLPQALRRIQALQDRRVCIPTQIYIIYDGQWIKSELFYLIDRIEKKNRWTSALPFLYATIYVKCSYVPTKLWRVTFHSTVRVIPI